MKNHSLSRYTSWKIGGPADLFIPVDSLSSLQLIYPYLHTHKIPHFVIGKGSNILIPDDGVRGAVIHLTGEFEHISNNDTLVTAGAGASFVRLCLLAAKLGLSGLEFGSGIPGSVGGAVRMNAGAHGSDVSRVLDSAKVITPTGEIYLLTNQELEFAYRTSFLNQKPYIVIESTFSLASGSPELISEITRRNKQTRLSTQPLKQPSCGSVFKNPTPEYAANLIERSGLKGVRIGDAQISELHGNFIVNLGHASANDILALIQLAVHTVNENFGIRLEPEVQILGDAKKEASCR